ncbi:Ferric siderophore transport system, periplasmic binding protein TonB [Halomonas citrativorans]|uniref:Ferric siderophore transport system, periplasmic binding protein TonB n=1 Tax=Halomonas citrativorans TaxID=2742612 RepID=A0A1R4I086_9GAMM|nr:TonB family protein [Halomonas citrativorans]SJN13179.1 Ferric siderophore transport system, periplasmic binding protein TonB [Halomonas citrativorans]
MPRLMSQRIGFYVGLSVFLHLIVGVFWLKQDADSVVATKATESVSMSVGLQAAMAGGEQKSDATQPDTAQAKVPLVTTSDSAPKEALQEVVDEPLSELPEPAEDKAAPPVERRSPVAKTDKPVPEPVPDPVVAERPDPVKQSEPTAQLEQVEQPLVNQKAVDNTQAENEMVEAVAGHAGEDGSSAEGVVMEETGIAQANSADVDNRYDLLVRQHLLENKQTPRVMGARRIEEVITVEFTLDRNGNVLSHQLVGLSRVRELNQAGGRLVESAMPFPRAPAGISWQSRVYTIDVRYQIK